MPDAPDDDAGRTGRAIDQFDMEIVAFIVCWVPYGGPPQDECVPRFGMSVDRLRARFSEIVRDGSRGHLSSDDRALLERAATLCTLDVVERQQVPHGRSSPRIGNPTLRRGVWRWS